MEKQTQQLILMLTIGILIGVVFVQLFTNVRTPIVRGINSTPMETGTPMAGVLEGATLSQAKQLSLPPMIPSNARTGLHVDDQLAFRTVVATGLQVGAISWVAVYDERAGGPGSILGAQKVKPGETTATIELLRPEGTLSGMTYYAAILLDDGDGEFNRLTDLPSFSPDKVVIVKFKAL